MKRIASILFLAASVFAEEPRGELVESMPPAPQILAAARAQLPLYPVQMVGTLKEWAPNGFMKRTLNVEMRLDWNAAPPQAAYQIRDEKNNVSQGLEIQWLPGGPEFQCLENGVLIEGFDPHTEINRLGITWSDLSFSFLWSQEAKTLRTAKKLGRDCFVISVPRPENHALLLWVEQNTGRMLGAEEQDADGKMVKIIKVVSVKEFDGLWMVKDLDIIQPGRGGRTSLRVDRVETGN
ncbi:MAG: outer membrane lipoprotein-sorting protein [Verrucomicrobia bacterium]|nr:outer membrane lipoprotein-sorting protein [Verrucomicrobiota bacterium]